VRQRERTECDTREGEGEERRMGKMQDCQALCDNALKEACETQLH
jgi:hypothetical protein